MNIESGKLKAGQARHPAISTAEIIEPSAEKTRTWPTRRIIEGASREPKRKPRK